MAKIGNINFTIGEKYPRPYAIYYTQKWKFEIRGIDEEFFNLTKVSNSGYSTERELETAILKAIPVYHAKKKKERLVIGYRCIATSALRMNEIKKGSYHGQINGVSLKIKGFDAFNTPYCAVGIDYDIYMEIFDGKKNEYFAVNEEHKVCSSYAIGHNDINGRTFVNYSNSNFEFFETIKEGMKGMIKNMSKFFELDPVAAQALIESKQDLLN